MKKMSIAYLVGLLVGIVFYVGATEYPDTWTETIATLNDWTGTDMNPDPSAAKAVGGVTIAMMLCGLASTLLHFMRRSAALERQSRTDDAEVLQAHAILKVLGAEQGKLLQSSGQSAPDFKQILEAFESRLAEGDASLEFAEKQLEDDQRLLPRLTDAMKKMKEQRDRHDVLAAKKQEIGKDVQSAQRALSELQNLIQSTEKHVGMEIVAQAEEVLPNLGNRVHAINGIAVRAKAVADRLLEYRIAFDAATADKNGVALKHVLQDCSKLHKQLTDKLAEIEKHADFHSVPGWQEDCATFQQRIDVLLEKSKHVSTLLRHIAQLQAAFEQHKTPGGADLNTFLEAVGNKMSALQRVLDQLETTNTDATIAALEVKIAKARERITSYKEGADKVVELQQELRALEAEALVLKEQS